MAAVARDSWPPGSSRWGFPCGEGWKPSSIQHEPSRKVVLFSCSGLVDAGSLDATETGFAGRRPVCQSSVPSLRSCHSFILLFQFLSAVINLDLVTPPLWPNRLFALYCPLSLTEPFSWASSRCDNYNRFFVILCPAPIGFTADFHSFCL